MATAHVSDDERHNRSERRTNDTDSTAPQRLSRPGGSALSLGDAVVQAKLTVGPAVDPYEREADAVADRVVRSLSGGAGNATDSDAARRDPHRPNEPESVARRIQRAAATIGAEGGAVDADTDRAIRSSRGGGKAMPMDARTKMEGAFGADFGSIRVHEGPQATELNNRIQAKAFTVGRDVYFRDGMPDTASAAGQHLLAHELTHTLQQGGAVARSTDTTAAPAARVSRAPAAVQRLAESRLPVGAFSYEASATAVMKSRRKSLFPAGSVIRVDDSTVLPSDEDPSSRWMLVTSVSAPKGQTVAPAPPATAKKKSWWKGTKGDAAPTGSAPVAPSRYGWFPAALLDVGPGGEAPGVDPLETIDEVISPLGTMGDVGDDLGSDGDDLLRGTQEKDLGIAGGVGGSVSGLLALASSIQKWREAKTGQDQFEALLDTIDSSGSTASGVAGLVKSASDAQKGSTTADAVGGLGMFGSIFAGIKSTYELVKQAVDLAKNSQKMTRQEQLESTMAIITSLLEAAAAGVSTAKTFLDTFGAGANEALKNTVPGFGIALGTVDMIVRAVALVQGLVQKSRMRTDKRSKKQDLEIELPDGRKVTGRRGEKFEAATLYKKLTKKAENDETSLTDREREFLARCDASEQFQQYLFSKGLQYINTKRANRAILKMSVAMTQIAADVATLGGASAPVGVGLKAGAMALDVGSSVFRKQKQYFRDLRATKEKSGVAVNGFLNMYDSKKSSTAKLRTYNKMVDRIFDMIVTASRLEAPAPPMKDPRFVQVKKYLAAIGISMVRVNSFQNDPAGLRTTMIEYLQKRE